MNNLYKSKTYVSDLDVAIQHVVGIEKLKNKKLLITGASGTIGSFVTDVIIRYNYVNSAGMVVYVAGRCVENLKMSYKGFKEVTVLPYDLRSIIGFDVCIDYIIHIAGNAHPAAFNGDPVGTIVDNINSTYNLLEYGRFHGTKRLLYVSSAEVYGQGDINVEEFEESYAGYLDLQSSRSCYPSSKRATENLCASYSKQYNFETVIVRPCHTYGPHFTLTDNRASVQFIKNALKGEDIVMNSAGTQMRSYSYIADCVSALLTVLIEGKSGEVYNIANPNSKITIVGLAEIIAEVVGSKVIFAGPNVEDLANRTPITKQILSSKKIMALGWSGVYTVKKGIEHTLAILQGE